MQPVSIAIIGSGIIGTRHAQAAIANPALVRLAAVCDLRNDAAVALATTVGAPVASFDAILADPTIAGVVLAMPAKFRVELALRALVAGKHVLLEKPAARTQAELLSILRVAGDRIVASCASRFSLLPSARAAAGIVASGVLGPIRTVRARGMTAAGAPPQKAPPIWRLDRDLNGGGILTNWGVYDLDYLMNVVNWSLQPRSAFAMSWGVAPAYAGWVSPNSDAETLYTAILRCQGGEAIILERGEFIAGPAEAVWEVAGERGTLRLNMLPKAGNRIELVRYDAAKGAAAETVWEGDEQWSALDSGPLYDFATAISGQRQPCSGPQQALVVQGCLDAIATSAASGTLVPISIPAVHKRSAAAG